MQPSISTIWVNGKPISAPAHSTIMQACMQNNIEIPRFCYHEQLAIAGNCRMCLVEVEKSPKLVASCAMPIINGMKIVTTSSIVKKARESVLEFLLLNHPLDCPICDQGGECDLQDQAMIYGSDRGRFYEFKRSVQDKQIGPLIKTIMTRCIHCTRCVRFVADVAHTSDLGTTGRGTNTEITTYIKKLWINSNISGNVIDLCPVGALTSKPYAFKARPWELQSKETIDILDPFCVPIRVDLNPFEVLRVLPLHGKWITDKTRFSYDGLNKQRLLSPMYRSTVLSPIGWERLLSHVKAIISNNSIVFHIGSLTSLETLVAAKLFKTHHTASISFHLEGVPYEYLKNAFSLKRTNTYTKLDIIKTKKLVFMTDVSVDDMSPLLSTVLQKTQDIFYLGVHNKSLRGRIKHFGFSNRSLLKILEGKNFISTFVKKAQGTNIHISKQFSCVQSIASLLNAKFDAVCTLPSSVSVNTSLNVLSLSDFIEKTCTSTSYVHWLLNANRSNMTTSGKDSRTIYHGTHADSSVAIADIVIPGVTYTEFAQTYIDVEGTKCKTNSVQSYPSLSFFCSEAEFILYVLFSSKITSSLNLIDIKFLISSFLSNFLKYSLSSHEFYSSSNASNLSVCSVPSYCSSFTDDYYTTNYISRASTTMARCSMLKSTEIANTF